MIYPELTAFYGGLLGLMYVFLSLWVTMGRLKFKAFHGDGGHLLLQRRIRAHSNFAEYVPLALILIGFNEVFGTPAHLVRAFLLLLILSRGLHPYGVLAREGSRAQFLLRGTSMVLTWTILGLSAALLLLIS